MFSSVGAGYVATRDDLYLLQAEDDPRAVATERQLHPTSVLGAGARVFLGPHVAVRLEGRALIYVETVDSGATQVETRPLAMVGLALAIPTRHRDAESI